MRLMARFETQAIDGHMYLPLTHGNFIENGDSASWFSSDESQNSFNDKYGGAKAG
jgi:hypothetical protein